MNLFYAMFHIAEFVKMVKIHVCLSAFYNTQLKFFNKKGHFNFFQI